MEKDNVLFLILIGVVASILYGGIKNPGIAGPISNTNNYNQTATTKEEKITEIQKQIKDIKEKITEEENKSKSQYYGAVNLTYVNRSDNPTQEYLVIKVNNSTTTNIKVTNWKIKSKNSGNEVVIPKGTYLFFTGMSNAEEEIILTPNETLYLISGYSPNGFSFKLNKCSGYLEQFQDFIPYIATNCPAPKNEDLSSIPKTANNDPCFDHIEYMSSCKIETETLPLNWGSECRNFIYEKINYPSCITIHKNDKDFYLKEWRVYLNRSSNIWKEKREEIVLYDQYGKIVDTLKY